MRVTVTKYPSSSLISGGEGDIFEERCQAGGDLPGVTRRNLAYGEGLLLTEFTYEKGARAPLHRHPHEQITYLVEGRLNVAGIPTRVEKGTSYLIPSNVEEGQFALGRTVTADMGRVI